MIDTGKYEGHTEGKWHCETGDGEEVQCGASIEVLSFHSKEFLERWLADASLRHETQQDIKPWDEKTTGIITNIAHINHPDDEGRGGLWWSDNARLVPDEIWQREQRANMRLIADAPLILQALIDERAEVKRLREEVYNLTRANDTAWTLLKVTGDEE